MDSNSNNNSLMNDVNELLITLQSCRIKIENDNEYNKHEFETAINDFNNKIKPITDQLVAIQDFKTINLLKEKLEELIASCNKVSQSAITTATTIKKNQKMLSQYTQIRRF